MAYTSLAAPSARRTKREWTSTKSFVHDLMKALSLLQILSKDRERVAIELCSRSSIAVHRVSERLKLLSLFRGPQLCDPSVERPAIELRSRSLSSWEKVSERPQQLAVPNASLAVPSATQTTDSVDSRGLSLLTPRGSVVVMYRRSTLHDEDLGEVVGLSGTAVGTMKTYTRSSTTWWRTTWQPSKA